MIRSDSRPWTAAALTVLAGLSVVAGHPLLASGLVCLAVAACGSPHPATVLERFPLAVTGVLAWLIVATHASGILGLDLFGSRPASGAVLVAPGILSALWSRARRTQTADPEPHLPVRPRWEAGLLTLPALSWVTLGVLGDRLHGDSRMAWFGEGIDNIQHALLVQLRLVEGGLTYDRMASPGGAHSAIALVLATDRAASPASGPGSTTPAQQALDTLIQVTSLSLWCVYGVIVLAISVLGLRLMRIIRPSAPTGLAVLIGVTSGFAVMTAPFPRVVGLGFVTFVFCAQGLTAAILAVTEPDQSATTSTRNVVVAAAAITLGVHTWPLAVVGVVPAGVLALRTAWQRRPGPPALVATAVPILFMATSSALSAWATIQSVDPVARTGTGGIVPPVHVIPVVWLLLALPVAATLLHRRRALLVAASYALLGALACGLAWWAHVKVTSYYPSKVLWIAGLLAVPLALAGLAWMALTLAGPRGQVVRAAAALAALGVGGSALVGTARLALNSTTDWAAMHAAATSGPAPEATIAWDIPEGSAHVAHLDRMLDFYRLDEAVLRRFPRTRTLALDCADLAHDPRPAVLTHHTQAEVDAHFPCAPGTRALTIPR